MVDRFDEGFLSGVMRDHRQSALRMKVTLAVALALAAAAGWRPALAWAVCTLLFEEGLRRLTRPIAEGEPPTALTAWGALLLRLLVICAWIFLGVILWSRGAAAAAMGFFAALLLHLIARRERSPALAVTAAPALIAPILTPLFFPLASWIDEAVVLLLAGLVTVQAGRALLRGEPEAAPAPRRAARPAAPPTDDEELSLEALREAKAQAEAASQAKSAFLATMSHEIRTPLNGVLGMTQVLAADPTLKQAQRERLKIIRESGESLLAILNDILDLSKIEAGKLELETIEFDLDELVGASHASFKALAAQKGLALKLLVDPAAKGVYLGDPTRVRQVLYNLISNALKFTERGEIRISVDSVGGRAVCLAVADTGVGIDAAQLERMFGKFEQIDPSSTRRYGGTGLGLAICRELCGLMGGSIRAESEPGRGARFLVTLPLPRVAEGSPASAAAAGPAEPPEPDGGELRILAAEDNPTNQLVLKALLAQFGIEPDVVDNGAQALEAWANHAYDLILMDVQMPEMDGMAATRAIRREEASSGRARTPIIALTANAMAHQVAEYAEVGMDAHVPKPIDVRTLLATITSLLAEPSADDEPASGRIEAHR